MTKRLVSLSRLIEDVESEGLDLEQTFIDPDDIVQLEDQAEEE